MKTRILLPILLALSLAAGLAAARADVVTLVNGAKVEGTVVGEDEQSIRLEIKPGSVQTIYRDDIARIEKFSDPKTEFARRKAALEAEKKPGPDSARAWFALGRFAAEKKLAAEARAAYEKAIAVDPDQAEARAALGFERVGREWLPQAEARKRAGLIEYEGRWVKPEEKQKLEQGYVLDEDGQWVKKEVIEARKAAEEEKARKAREAEEAWDQEHAERAREHPEHPEAHAATTTARAVTTAATHIRVVQFNIRFDFESDGPNRWSHRVPLVAGLIAQAHADVVCFQEDKSDQVDDLKRVMPGWEFVSGKGRNGGQSEHCSIAFDTRRWKCAESGDFWLSDTPDVVGSNTWGTPYPHKVTWARLEGGGRDVIFTSTHLDEHADAGPVREKSAKVIRQWLSKHAVGANVVVCGDFNASTDDPAHAVMMDPAPAPRLVECWDTLRKGDTATGTCHEFTGKARKKRIDWMFCAGNVAPLEIKIDRWNKDGRYPSDHFALVAELEVGPKGKHAAH